jgi:hypothetical protein
MPFVDTATEPPCPEPSQLRITDPKYKGIAVDTRYIPVTDLLTHIEGSSWTVDYYVQVLDQDNGVAGQSVNTPAQLQQYRRVKGLELKVTQPLTASQDQATKKMSYDGAASMYPVVIPNKGDMFIAQTDDGRFAIFMVEDSERKSFYKDSIFTITYNMQDYAIPERLLDLESKVIVSYEYVKDYLQAGQNPLVESSQWTGIAKLHNRAESILGAYTKQFFSKEYNTFIVPGQSYPTYDHWLTKALQSMFNATDTPELLNMRILNVDDNESMAVTTLWDALIQKDPQLLKFVNKRAATVWVNRFTRNPMLNGIRYSGIAQVVFPLNPELTVDQELYPGLEPITDSQLVDVPSRRGRLEDMLPQVNLNGLPYSKAPLIYPVLIDDYYILSAAFYHGNTANQSQLELLVGDYLNDRAIHHDTLLAFCDTWHAWPRLAMFYYTPIVLLLIRAALRRV